MKNLAELKNIKIGTKIMKVYHNGLVSNESTRSTIGKIRTVDAVKSRCFSMDGAWLDFPKANKFIGTDKGFKILFYDSNDVLMEFIIL